MKIHKGDTVRVIAGKDKGREGKVLEAMPKVSRAVVESVNIRKKHVRPRKAGEKGQIIESPISINASNLVLICPNCKKPVRVASKVLADGKKQRWCRKCNTAIAA